MTLARVPRALDILERDNAGVQNWAAAYAVVQQVRLRLDRALKKRRDDIIVGMEADGLKDLGPLSIKSTAVDPVYVCNERGNWQDAGVQDAMNALRHDPTTNPYIRVVPAHFEVDVDRLAEDIRLGAQVALDLYGELNRRGWRKEQARRLSLAVREARPAA